MLQHLYRYPRFRNVLRAVCGSTLGFFLASYTTDTSAEPAESNVTVPYSAALAILARASGSAPVSAAGPQLRITSNRPGVTPSDIVMYIDSKTGRIPIDIKPDGTFALPRSEALLSENPMIITNQPKGTLVTEVALPALGVAPWPIGVNSVKYSSLQWQGVEANLNGVKEAASMAVAAGAQEATIGIKLRLVTDLLTGREVIIHSQAGEIRVPVGDDGMTEIPFREDLRREDPVLTLPVLSYQEIIAKAEAGDVKFQVNLARLYASGEGAERDPAKSYKWNRRAAETGDPGSQYNVGLYYSNGEVVDKNPTEAIAWFTRAAEQGFVPAQLTLARCYAKGFGVPASDKDALAWYRAAAEQGNSAAEVALGGMYHKGKGVQQDFQEARKWYEKAAGHGSAAALHNLGLLYENGHGVTADKQKAIQYFQQAADRGNKAAQKELRKLLGEDHGPATVTP